MQNNIESIEKILLNNSNIISRYLKNAKEFDTYIHEKDLEKIYIFLVLTKDTDFENNIIVSPLKFAYIFFYQINSRFKSVEKYFKNC
jgi:hypothetical protein